MSHADAGPAATWAGPSDAGLTGPEGVEAQPEITHDEDDDQHPPGLDEGRPRRDTCAAVDQPTATEVWIDDTLLEATQLERIVPAPAEEIRAEDGTTFIFDRSTGARTRATFHMTGDAVGIVRGRTGVSPGDTAAVSVLFYP